MFGYRNLPIYHNFWMSNLYNEFSIHGCNFHQMFLKLRFPVCCVVNVDTVVIVVVSGLLIVRTSGDGVILFLLTPDGSSLWLGHFRVPVALLSSSNPALISTPARKDALLIVVLI